MKDTRDPGCDITINFNNAICTTAWGGTCPGGTPPQPPSPPRFTSAGTPNAETTDDPVQVATGEYFLLPQVDLDLGGPLPLYFSRIYAAKLHSEGMVRSVLGSNWVHNFDFHLRFITVGYLDVIYTGGKIISFAKTGANWGLSSNESTIYQLQQDAAGNYLLLDPSSRLVYLFNATGVLQTIQDRNGNTLTLTHDVAGTLNQVSDGLGRTLNFTYAGTKLTQVTDGTRVVNYAYTAGVLTGAVDPMGNTTTYLYDTTNATAGPLMTDMQLPLGNKHYTQVFDANSRVTTQTDAFTNALILQYDTPSFGITTLTDALGNSRQTTHQSQRTMTNRQDVSGKSTALGYDANGRRTSLTDRMGDASHVTYHAQTGYVASFTNARGGTINYTYTARNQSIGTVPFTFYNLTRIDYPDGTNQQFTFDGKGNVLSQIDQAGNTTTYTFDSRGKVLAITLPTGGTVTYTYNLDETLASKTNSDTGVTTYAYDALKRPVTITHPDLTTIQVAYDPQDRITSITDENGNPITYAYDANGNLVSETDPAGNLTQYAYDLMDRVTGVTDRLGTATAYSYDVMGHLASIIDANSDATTFGYDARGWMNQTGSGGQIWQTSYDSEGVPTAFLPPIGRLTGGYQTQSDKAGYATKLTDPLGHSSTMARDGMSRLTAVTDALARTTSYSYDGRGLLASVSKAVAGTATYSRNQLGALSMITDLNGSNWNFAYTGMGRLQSSADPLGSAWQYAYDTQGRLSNITYPGGATLNHSYDPAGNLTGKSYADGTNLLYGYDNRERLISANNLTLTKDQEGQVINTASAGTNFGATFDNGGRLSTVSYNNGAFTVTYAYSAVTGLLSRVSDSLTGATVDFTYDTNLGLTGMNRANGVNTILTSDSADRITRIQDGSIVDIQYTLDVADQVTNMSMIAPLTPTGLLTVSSQTLSHDAASQVNTVGYSYDTRGRRIAEPGTSYIWDDASRLTGIGAVTLAYNGMGDLITRSQGATTIGYDYNYAIGMTPIVAEKDSSTGSYLRYYIWTPAGRLLYMIDAANGNKVYYYHYDRNGSTLALTDSTGTVSDAYAYSPYGRLLQHNGLSQQPFTFIGEWGVRQEGGSGALYHIRARYYDAVTGAFLTRDANWPNIKTPEALNPYEYASGNPQSFADISGQLKLNPAKLAKIAAMAKKIAKGAKKSGKYLKKGAAAQGNVLTKAGSQKKGYAESALFGIASQVPGSSEIIDVVGGMINGEKGPPQGREEYIAGGVTRDLVTGTFTLGKFGLQMAQDLATIHVGNRRDPDKYLGFWTELGYETARQVSESKYIIPGLITGAGKVEEGWTKIGEYGAYGYRQSIGSVASSYSQTGSQLGTMLYGSKKEKARMNGEINRSHNLIDVGGRTIGNLIGGLLY